MKKLLMEIMNYLKNGYLLQNKLINFFKFLAKTKTNILKQGIYPFFKIKMEQNGIKIH